MSQSKEQARVYQPAKPGSTLDIEMTGFDVEDYVDSVFDNMFPSGAMPFWMATGMPQDKDYEADAFTFDEVFDRVPPLPPAPITQESIVYSYNGLSGTSSFRLLKALHSEESRSMLSFEMNEFKIDDDEAPPYVALSYTWGCAYPSPNYELANPSETQSYNEQYTSDRNVIILVNGSQLLITRNAYDALQRLRQRHNIEAAISGSQDSPFLWIDSVCINQDDNVEKSVQVALMNQIYSNASHVVIWLGNWLARTHLALGFLDYLCCLPDEKKALMKDLDPTMPGTYARLGMEEIPPELWAMALSFLSRRWFSRIWMIQEFCEAKTVVFLCGITAVSWGSLQTASQMLVKSGWDIPLTLLRRYVDTRYDLRDVEDPYLEGPYHLQYLSDRWNQAPGRYAARTNLWEIVKLSRPYAATNPYDKVYALLPMINTRLRLRIRRDPLKPDYNRPLAHIYREITGTIILTDENLRCLTDSRATRYCEIANMPSWCMNLQDDSQSRPLKMYFKWSAAGTEAQFAQIEKLSFLHINGYQIDTVKGIGSNPGEMTDLDDLFYEWISLVEDYKLKEQTKEGGVEVLWRTLIADTSNLETPAPVDFGLQFSDYLLQRMFNSASRPQKVSLTEEEELEIHGCLGYMMKLKKLDPSCQLPEIDELIKYQKLVEEGPDRIRELYMRAFTQSPGYRSAILAAVRGRAIVQSEKGLIGLGTEEVQDLDEIWILPMLNVPIILRPLVNGKYRVVGDAYIHGMMHGEALQIPGLKMERVVLQ